MIKIRAQVKSFFDLFAVAGIAAIAEQASGTPASFGWTDFNTAVLDCGGMSLTDAAHAVKAYATALESPDSWVMARAQLGDSTRASLSPRVGAIGDDDWQMWQRERWLAVDRIAEGDWLSQYLVGALGEPPSWHTDPQGPDVNIGASVWEMKTRNRGEEFVQNRFARLTQAVASRDIPDIERALSGEFVSDEVAGNKADSRTPTGLRPPGPTDNVFAWCALWAISNFPTRPVIPTSRKDERPRSRSAGSFTQRVNGTTTTYLTAPVPRAAVSLARYRAVCRSQQLITAARGIVARTDPTLDAAQVSAARGWLVAHGIQGVSVARKHFSDNPNAPEPWAVFEQFDPIEQLVLPQEGQ